MLYVFAVIGAITVTIKTVKIINTFRKDLRSKPTPWLGLPWGP